MLHDLANDVGFVALKQAAEYTEGWRHREMMSKTCFTAEDYSLIPQEEPLDMLYTFSLISHVKMMTTDRLYYYYYYYKCTD